jgi:DNA polymerase-3 subunit gamma/tau
VFGVVDKVIETGQDPRRFTEDLLRRLRDLVIVSAVPDAPATGLIDIAEDAAERLVAQAARFGPAELSRAADLVATGLTEMRGATAPRLLLELICARVLLPGADHSTEGVLARLDRLERRMTISGGEPSGAPPAPPTQATPATSATPVEPAPAKPAPPVNEPTAVEPEPPAESEPEPAQQSTPEPVAPDPAPAAATTVDSTLTLVDVRRLWPDIVEATKQRRRLTWIYLTQQAQVVGVDDKTLTLGFANAGARDSFDNGGSAEIVRQAAIDVVGHDWRVETIVDPGAEPDAATPPAPPTSSTTSTALPAQPAGPQLGSPASSEPGTSQQPPEWAEPDSSASADPPERPSASAREAIAPTRGRSGEEEPTPSVDPDGGARHDDTDAESSGVDGAKLLQEALGAQVIDEIPHQ